MKEITRPTIYRTMKYWGKKPHNIWSSYIEKYSKRNDVVLDPFVGSGMTYFESIRLNRIPITIDLNPISDFTIKCLTYRNINYDEIKEELQKIINKVKLLDCYQNEYICVCSKCGKNTDVYNYKINGNITISYKCNYCKETITEIVDKKTHKYKIDKWVPQKKLDSIESISNTFIKKIGSNNFYDIWSNRNIKLLSEIYDEILKVENDQIKDVLIFGFIQCLHLTSKMCIPRGDKSKRPLSTSWGRPAYMISDKVFEQNPILAFEKAVCNSTGVISGIKSSEKYIGNNFNNNSKHYFGDALQILKKIDSESIDMAITDPPYGDIIQYGDLSEVWVSWLEKSYPKYKIDHNKEVIVNRNKSQSKYEKLLTNIFKEVNRVLKTNSVFVLTFNSNNNDDWISLFNSIKKSNFYIEKVIYQINKRSSEANVAAKEGIAISDYYFICKKGTWSIKKIEKIIKERGLQLDE
mgnify:CR=1 FL=1